MLEINLVKIWNYNRLKSLNSQANYSNLKYNTTILDLAITLWETITLYVLQEILHFLHFLKPSDTFLDLWLFYLLHHFLQ